MKVAFAAKQENRRKMLPISQKLVGIIKPCARLNVLLYPLAFARLRIQLFALRS